MARQVAKASTPEILDSFNSIILAKGRVTAEDISEQQMIFLDTPHKVEHDGLAFSKFIIVFHRDNP